MSTKMPLILAFVILSCMLGLLPRAAVGEEVFSTRDGSDVRLTLANGPTHGLLLTSQGRFCESMVGLPGAGLTYTAQRHDRGVQTVNRTPGVVYATSHTQDDCLRYFDRCDKRCHTGLASFDPPELIDWCVDDCEDRYNNCLDTVVPEELPSY